VPAFDHPQHSRSPWISFWGLAGILAFSFLINPLWLRDSYGDGGGKWDDSIDSYSDYLVRNKLKNEILGTENLGWFLIQCAGYSQNDFSFRKEGTQKYYSNCGHQVWVLIWIARIFDLDSEPALDRLARIARAFNAVALAAVLAVFLARVGKQEGNRWIWVAGLVVAGSSGLILFAKNLYYCIWLFALPLAVSGLIYGKVRFRWVLIAHVSLAYLNFSRSYEFASLYSLLCILPVIVFEPATPFGTKALRAAGILACTVVGFIAVVGTHVHLVHVDTGNGYSESMAKAFSTLRMRTLTAQDVPEPVSIGFVKRMGRRWLEDGVALPPMPGLGVQVPKVTLVLLAGLVLWSRRRWLDATDWQVLVWCPLAYLSWYLLAYQHNLHHHIFDRLLFSFTFGLALPLVLYRRYQGVRSMTARS